MSCHDQGHSMDGETRKCSSLRLCVFRHCAFCPEKSLKPNGRPHRCPCGPWCNGNVDPYLGFFPIHDLERTEIRRPPKNHAPGPDPGFPERPGLVLEGKNLRVGARVWSRLERLPQPGKSHVALEIFDHSGHGLERAGFQSH